jgi:tetratricopeptide (TPR) repeat protein
MNSETASFLNILRERVDDLRKGGDLDEAVHAANAAVEKAQEELNTEPQSIDAFVDAVEVRADLFRQIGWFEKALDDYRQSIMVLEECNDHEGQLGRLYAGLGAVYDATNELDRAEAGWSRAADYFKNADPPAWLDVAGMWNNLAFLRRAVDDLEQAETYFLKALEVVHRELGPKHAETALLYNNLGACYQAGGHYEQAREMHLMALEARRNQLGEYHPDTAQSHNNLALTLEMTGEHGKAVKHFEEAMKGFEAAGGEFGKDLAAVTANFEACRRQQNDTPPPPETEPRPPELSGCA